MEQKMVIFKVRVIGKLLDYFIFGKYDYRIYKKYNRQD